MSRSASVDDPTARSRYGLLVVGLAVVIGVGAIAIAARGSDPNHETGATVAAPPATSGEVVTAQQLWDEAARFLGCFEDKGLYSTAIVPRANGNSLWYAYDGEPGNENYRACGGERLSAMTRSFGLAPGRDQRDVLKGWRTQMIDCLRAAGSLPQASAAAGSEPIDEAEVTGAVERDRRAAESCYPRR